MSLMAIIQGKTIQGLEECSAEEQWSIPPEGRRQEQVLEALEVKQIQGRVGWEAAVSL